MLRSGLGIHTGDCAIKVAQLINLQFKGIHMKTKITAVAALTFFSVFALPSFAGDAAVAEAAKVHPLKDGGSLYVFKDGKMAQTNKFGNTAFLQPGQAIETADGQKLTASSNEVARLSSLLRQGHRN